MKVLVAIAIFVLVVKLLDAVSPHDDSDPPGKRSGLRIYTDNRTGLQYLGTGWGGITPRLDANGNHIRSTQQ